MKKLLILFVLFICVSAVLTCYNTNETDPCEKSANVLGSKLIEENHQYLYKCRGGLYGYDSKEHYQKIDGVDLKSLQRVQEDFYKDDEGVLFIDRQGGEWTGRTYNVIRLDMVEDPSSFISRNSGYFEDDYAVYHNAWKKYPLQKIYKKKNKSKLQILFLSEEDPEFSDYMKPEFSIYVEIDNTVFYSGKKMIADGKSFRLISYDYSSDKNYVFFKGEVLKDVNPMTFKRVFDDYCDAYYSDGTQVFYYGKQMFEAKSEELKIVSKQDGSYCGCFCAADDKNFYLYGEIQDNRSK